MMIALNVERIPANIMEQTKQNESEGELARRCLQWQRRALAAELKAEQLQQRIDQLIRAYGDWTDRRPQREAA